MTAIGVDGAPGGWVAASRSGVRGFARFDDLLASAPRATFFVDIPIGLVAEGASGDRACDREARAALGARRGSVFVPPTRAQLALADRPFRAGLGISAQTHGMLRRIREVDAFREDPRVRESHPELAFLLAGRGRALAPKRTPEGRAARGRILRALGLAFAETGLGVRAKRDDVDDAAILCWLGEQALAGRAGCYGEPPFVIWGRASEARPQKPYRARLSGGMRESSSVTSIRTTSSRSFSATPGSVSRSAAATARTSGFPSG